MLEDHELDLAQREADIALRMRAPVQADLIQRKLFTVHYHIYASRNIWRAPERRRQFEDLVNHTIIVYGETAAPEIRDVNWLLDATRRLAPRRRRPHAAHQQHHGNFPGDGGRRGHFRAAGLHRPRTAGTGRDFARIDGPSFDAHLVYCDALRQSKRVGAFRDFLVRSARDWRF